jgi:endonuclease/exonuclease/phosphatase family metal-dependent hydrolase
MKFLNILFILTVFFIHQLNANTISILSWNVKFLPRIFLHIEHHPLKRVIPVSNHILNENADVVVLQEAFDHTVNHRLLKHLKSVYPYHIGPANTKGLFTISSGILILSKYPIKELGTIDFKDCEKEDCFAKKGALLVEVEINGKTIQVLGTHLEAGGPAYIKKNQYLEIAGLLEKNQRNSIPQLICGDFNTSSTNTELYPVMLSTLNATDGELIGEYKYSADHFINDMCPYDPNDRSVIDYIFYKSNGLNNTSVTREIMRFTFPWRKKNKDLSDHFAIKAEVKYN